MKILITGANGMLAKAVKNEFEEHELICTDVAELDITNLEAVKEFVVNTNPDLIINCAAYTAVDKAEEQEELAYKINAIGPKNLAIASNANDSIVWMFEPKSTVVNNVHPLNADDPIVLIPEISTTLIDVCLSFHGVDVSE